MVSAVNADKGDQSRVDLLQLFTMRDWNEQVFCAMYNIGMTFYLLDPFIRS